MQNKTNEKVEILQKNSKYALKKLALVVIILGAFITACPFSTEMPFLQPKQDAGSVQEDVSLRVLALAGPDLEVLEGSRAVLQGGASRSLDGEVSLSWTQLEGPAVLLTNASGAAPAFVAPLAPATLRFRLSAEGAYGAVHIDDVLVKVTSSKPQKPFFVKISGDVVSDENIAEVAVSILGNPQGEVSFDVRAECGEKSSASLVGNRVVVERDALRPCPVIVDARDAEGRRAARGAFVFWPEADALVKTVNTQLRSNAVVVDPDGVLTFDSVPTLRPEETLVIWPADGKDLRAGERRDRAFVAPKERVTLRFAGERRRGVFSGGVGYIDVQVSGGLGNTAPIANGGPDRVVFPDAYFALDTRQSMDADGDALTFEVRQVIGPKAEALAAPVGTFQAASEAGIALFHVRAFDGQVFSAPDTVRVEVFSENVGVSPIVALSPQRFVTPQSRFTLDGSFAYDPDSGFVDRILIQQMLDDEVILLSEPVESESIELQAGADGEVYHFRISAFDQEGLSGFADVEVTVEDAGPYVDPIRGAADGRGTLENPFITLDAAIEVARRHEFKTLYLSAGEHAPFAEELPAGISLVGGVSFDELEGYQDIGAETVLPSNGFTLDNADVSRLTLHLTAPYSALSLRGSSRLSDVNLVGVEVQNGPLVEVSMGATATLERCSLTPRKADESGGFTLDIRNAFVVRLIDVNVFGGTGVERGGVRCIASALDVIGGEIIGGNAATQGSALLANECDVQLLGARLLGGHYVEKGIGAYFQDSVVIADNASQFIGVGEGTSTEAIALQAEGNAFAGFISGSLFAVDKNALDGEVDLAFAVNFAQGRLQLSNVELNARGALTAQALRANGESLDVNSGTIVASSLRGDAVGLWISQANSVRFKESTFQVAGKTALAVNALNGEALGVAVSLDLTDVEVEVLGEDKAQGLVLPSSAEARLLRVSLNVNASASTGQAQGMFLQNANFEEVSVIAVGSNGAGCAHLVGETGGHKVHRMQCEARAVGGNAEGLKIEQGGTLTSTAVFVEGETATGIWVGGEISALHVSVYSSGTAWESFENASIVLVNSLLHGDEVALDGEADASQWVGLALSGAVLLLTEYEDADGIRFVEEITDESELSQATCQSCRQVNVLAVVEPISLRLKDGNNVLVDAAVPGFAMPDDIDGEERTGLADIGCDERL